MYMGETKYSTTGGWDGIPKIEKLPARREAISNGWIRNSSMGYLNCYSIPLEVQSSFPKELFIGLQLTFSATTAVPLGVKLQISFSLWSNQ